MPDATIDPRLHAFRPDLADERLRGQVEAARFSMGEPGQAIRAVLPLKGRPDWAAPLDNEVLYGEQVRVFDVAGGWAWVQLLRDGYVGYVPADGLSKQTSEATHRVQSLGTFVYPTPDIKAPPLMHLSLGSALAVEGEDERFVRLVSGGFVIARHTTPATRFTRDFVEVAERFIGVPYLWGGRTRVGLDCSGLIQLALEAAGKACPRDSDMQQVALGSTVLVPADLEGLERGDLVFWRGHVGVMVDGALLLHANAHHMAVAVEPLAAAVDRNHRLGLSIAAIKRLHTAAA